MPEYPPSAEALQAELAALRRQVAELKAAEALRSEAAEAYRSLLDACPDAVVLSDLAGRIVFASPQTLELLGLGSTVDLRGRSVFEYVAPEDRSRLRENMARLITEKQRRYTEYRALRQDGTTSPVEISSAVLRDEAGHPKAAMAIIRDIRERKQAEEALQASHDELQAIYDAVVDGLAIIDIETRRCLRANPQAAAMLGYSLEEVPPLDPWNVHRPEDLPRIDAKFQSQVEGRLPVAENVPFLHKDGHLLYVDISSRRIDYQGRPCLISFLRDTTERKKAEEALRASEERFRAIFEEAPVGIVLGDSQRTIVRANRAFCQMLGCRPEELVERPIQDFLHTEDCQRVAPLVQQVLRGEIPSFTVEKRYLRKNGEPFWVQATTAAIHNLDGQVAFVVGIVEDIDERKQAQDALEREHQTLWHMLRSSDHERQLIAYEIHDGLAQQLAAALMQLQSCEHLHQSSSRQATYEAGIQMVRQAHFEARRLISGVRPPILDESGIVAALAHLVHDQCMLGGPKIEFQNQVSFGRLAPVLENAIYRIAQEAMTNACQHSQSSRVQVKLWEQEGQVGLEIRDWGVGFDSQTIGPDCFGVEGIRERARLLGGTMTLESALGQGTRIQVLLPLCVAEGFKRLPR